MERDVQESTDEAPSPLDTLRSGTYARVMIVEAIVIALLFILGRMFR